MKNRLSSKAKPPAYFLCFRIYADLVHVESLPVLGVLQILETFYYLIHDVCRVITRITLTKSTLLYTQQNIALLIGQ